MFVSKLCFFLLLLLLFRNCVWFGCECKCCAASSTFRMNAELYENKQIMKRRIKTDAARSVGVLISLYGSRVFDSAIFQNIVNRFIFGFFDI